MGGAEVDLAAEEAALQGRREPYVRATVVWARRPVSARPGDKAVVTSAGGLRGWVGGSCAEPVVIREAGRALAAGTPRLLRLGPRSNGAGADGAEEEGIVTAEVSCASEGSLQVFLEPVVPPTHLVVVGRSPLARALAGLAVVLRFDATLVERDAGHLHEPPPPPGVTLIDELDLAKADVGPASFVVVATMGRYDEDALEAALATDARYVALVASDRRAASVLAALRASGASEERLARVRSPAGLPLGDLPHEETAVAILAEIVQRKHASPTPVGAVTSGAVAPTREAVDPVCGMTVEIAASTPSAQRAGATFWFCCSACQRRFVSP